ncbi:MAG: dockerin type I repeat-containing protein [Bacteroidales bacterium]|nr:dockerin type I repeat-containing protein [Bacteroidales bacterium]
MIYVPDASVAAYKAALGWKEYASHIKGLSEEPKVLAGDLDGNGKLDVSDVTALLNHILGTASYEDALCDVDGNGRIDVSDVTALINKVLAI